MSENANFADELAALTDGLLAGQDMDRLEMSHELAYMVKQLYDVIAPDAPPDPAFRMRLRQRLIREWHLTYERQPTRWYQNRRLQLATLAASVALILVTIVLLSGNRGGDPVQGTALGSTGWVAIISGIVGGTVLLWVWLNRSRQS
jgi:hypothetical protein